MKTLSSLILVFLVSTGFIVQSDDDVIQILRQRLEAQNLNMARVKLDLLFHQPAYSPGDTALVRTLYLGAADHKLVGGREMIYLSVHDQKGNIVIREHLLVSNGWASNRIVIPETLNPGIYLVVAYSDWMRNESPDLFFRQDLIITGAKRLEKTDDSPAAMEIYPEGGSLITGVDNFVTIRKRGNSKVDQCVVLQGDQEIERLVFNADGLASFHFTPESGKIYSVRFADGNNSVGVKFPDALPNGFAIHVSEAPDHNLSARINIAIAENSTAKQFYLVIISAGGLHYSSKIDVESQKELTVNFPPGIDDGVAEIIIIDKNLKALVRRPVLIRRDNKIDVGIPNFKDSFSTREGVSLVVEAKDIGGKPLAGYYSAQILNKDAFSDSTNSEISTDNILLYSSISSTFKLKNTEDMASVLQYLNTQTCPWLKWNEIETGQIKDHKIPPKSQIVISGTVVSAETGQPVADETKVMFFFQKQMEGYERVIFNKGKFSFPLLFDFYDTEQVLYAASINGQDLNGITVKMNPIDTNYFFKADPWIATDRSDPFGSFNMQRRAIDKSYLFFAQAKNATDSSADLNHFAEKELGGADVVFRTSDYILFPSMPELIREVLKAVDYRKVKGKDVVRVYTNPKKAPSNYAGPLYIIDGIMTKETSAFLNLVPSKIITIKVITNPKKLSKWRTLGANGIILVRTTTAGEHPENLVSDNSFPVIGLAPVFKGREFLWRGTKSETPDFRTSLQWSTNVKLDGNGQSVLHFRTSDDATDFRIRIEGMSFSGQPFSKDFSFKIKYQPL